MDFNMGGEFDEFMDYLWVDVMKEGLGFHEEVRGEIELEDDWELVI
jgi:hypothetical protein